MSESGSALSDTSDESSALSEDSEEEDVNQGRNGHEMDKPALVQLRMCAVADCDFTVQNGLTNVDHILRAMSNHIAVTHTASNGEGGGAKSTATIPMLDEAITEVQYSAWKSCFDRYCVTCKLKDTDIVNRIFETIPSYLAIQIVIDLDGSETKDVIFAKIKGAVVKKRSVFLYRKDFHELRQNRGEDPERYATRIKQLAPACTFVSDNNTPRYGPDVMYTQFVLGLDDVYTKEQLYQMKPEPGKTTVSFEALVSAASEIAVAKDNVAEASTTSVCAISVGDKNKVCGFCNTLSHSDNASQRRSGKSFARLGIKFVKNVKRSIIWLWHVGRQKFKNAVKRTKRNPLFL